MVVAINACQYILCIIHNGVAIHKKLAPLSWVSKMSKKRQIYQPLHLIRRDILQEMDLQCPSRFFGPFCVL